MVLKLRDIYLGKVDGKFEYIIPMNERDRSFYDAYLIPDSVDVSKFHNSDRYFISGFRGTGKTSLLRWFGEMRRNLGDLVEVVLFKSEIPEERRQNLSSEVGVTWVDSEIRKAEFSQDFKTVWRWFILHKIVEVLNRDDYVRIDPNFQLIKRLLGIGNNSFDKTMGFLPRLEKLNVKVKADLAFFKAELGGEFVTKSDHEGSAPLSAISSRVLDRLAKINLDAACYVMFDELEVFYSEESKYHRDQRMVRDLIFVIADLNEHFRHNSMPLHLLGAVRSEVIEGFGAIGQEVERVVHDRGVKLAWHSAARSAEHPLFEMVARKIKLSDETCRNLTTRQIIETYFPISARGESIDAYLLDRSFYKPRDLIWRLTIAQDRFPESIGFTERVLLDTEQDYSNEMWKEVRYELTANYTDTDISVIETIFSGYSIEFELHDIEGRVSKLSTNSVNARKMLASHGVVDILNDLYRLGAIGNFFREGAAAANTRNRWAFRGDPTLLSHKRMTINPSLIKRLSMVRRQRRGTQRTGRN